MLLSRVFDNSKIFWYNKNMKNKNKNKQTKSPLTTVLQKDAEKIYLLEIECQQGRNVKENMAKIEEIMKNYSLLDMLKIDEYLTTKFFDK